LLKLRGELGVKQTELGVAKSERDQLVAVERARALREATVHSLKQIGLASLIFAQTNGDTFPTNFAQIEDQLSGLGANSGVGTNTFEFYDYGEPLSTRAAPYSIVAREKEPQQNPDGTFTRAYLMADGSVQTATSTNGDFVEWEKDWTQTGQFRFGH